MWRGDRLVHAVTVVVRMRVGSRIIALLVAVVPSDWSRRFLDSDWSRRLPDSDWSCRFLIAIGLAVFLLVEFFVLVATGWHGVPQGDAPIHATAPADNDRLSVRRQEYWRTWLFGDASVAHRSEDKRPCLGGATVGGEVQGCEGRHRHAVTDDVITGHAVTPLPPP